MYQEPARPAMILDHVPVILFYDWFLNLILTIVTISEIPGMHFQQTDAQHITHSDLQFLSQMNHLHILQNDMVNSST
jgi:hypothetical protein